MNKYYMRNVNVLHEDCKRTECVLYTYYIKTVNLLYVFCKFNV